MLALKSARWSSSEAHWPSYGAGTVVVVDEMVDVGGDGAVVDVAAPEAGATTIR